ncbi:MAG: P1 family peptidase [Patescibacteria group bacterium]
MNKTLTALKGVKVGHSTHLDKLTGTTVVVFDKELPLVFKSYGGSNGTFNTDAFSNGKRDNRANAIFISGGSWTGLQAGGEIMKRLIEKNIGYKTFKIINPNLAGAIVFDLGVRIDKFNPAFGREAVDNASLKEVLRGNVGAGTGTSVGKFKYYKSGKIFAGMKSGVGCGFVKLKNGGIVTAMTVVNAVGNIMLPNGEILAGNRTLNGKNKFLKFKELMEFNTPNKSNTTISIIGTNINLRTRENYERVAHLASIGHARAIDPINTSLDGDTIFVFSTEEIKNLTTTKENIKTRGHYWSELDTDIVGNAAARAVQESIYDACYQAETINLDDSLDGIVPSVKDYNKNYSQQGSL